MLTPGNFVPDFDTPGYTRRKSKILELIFEIFLI